MNDLTKIDNIISPMSNESINKVRNLEEITLRLPQVKISTDHVFHVGMYARTIMIPAGVVLTGALIKVATVLIISGNAIVYRDEVPTNVNGYRVLAASAHRKQAFYAIEDTYLTMIFKTSKKTIADVEEEFTDEASMLISRHEDALNIVTIGEE